MRSLISTIVLNKPKNRVPIQTIQKKKNENFHDYLVPLTFSTTVKRKFTILESFRKIPCKKKPSILNNGNIFAKEGKRTCESGKTSKAKISHKEQKEVLCSTC